MFSNYIEYLFNRFFFDVQQIYKMAYTLPPHYNTVVYSLNSIITWYTAYTSYV